jgi:ABC-type dipeptide/oligopeptide/nickel transport system permease subunit
VSSTRCACINAEAVVATWETGKDDSNDYAQDYQVATSVEAIALTAVAMRFVGDQLRNVLDPHVRKGTG